MKNKIYYLGAIILFLFAGCQKLDREIKTDLNKDLVESNISSVRSLLNGAYVELREGFQDVDGAMLASATDEAEHTSETSSIQSFNNGSWNAINNPNNVWGGFFRGIRRANVLLISTDNINLDQFKLDPSQQVVYNNYLDEIKRFKYEARFLRAFFYFELIKRYGGVPIMTSPLSDKDIPDVKRNTFEECVQFIVSECDSAANNLPVIFTVTNGTDLGRATKGAALALKARVLLYAASDLYNNPSWAAGFTQPLLISMPAGDRTARWKAAADAAKEVIDLPGTGYGMFNNYSTLFRAFNNTEIIFTRRATTSNSFETANLPVGFGGKGSTTPSQDLVDAYEIKVNATTSIKFDWNNPAHAANPYATTGALARDPRLFTTVLVNNFAYAIPGIIRTPPLVAEMYTGGRDGKPILNATKTGYYLRKYVNESLNRSNNQLATHSWIFFRLPEMYLNYAEALNEYEPGNANIKFYVDKVRTRTGVAMPPLPAGLSQVEMREKIRNEKRVEFAFEDHRAWDVRRWMIAPATLGGPLRGVEATVAGTSFTYAPFVVETRVFEPKMYFYPIPQGELNISAGLIQNPMW